MKDIFELFLIFYFIHIAKLISTEVVLSEAGTRRCSSKYVFLKMLQFSQENTGAGVTF